MGSSAEDARRERATRHTVANIEDYRRRLRPPVANIHHFSFGRVAGPGAGGMLSPRARAGTTIGVGAPSAQVITPSAPASEARAVLESILEHLRGVYTFSSDEIESYLLAHPHLIPVLLDAHRAIRRRFGEEPAPRLRVDRDGVLLLRVPVDGGADACMQAAEIIDREFWNDAILRARGDLSVDTEPR